MRGVKHFNVTVGCDFYSRLLHGFYEFSIVFKESIIEVSIASLIHTRNEILQRKIIVFAMSFTVMDFCNL